MTSIDLECSKVKESGNVLFVVYAAPIPYSHGVSVLSSVLKKAGIQTEVFIADGNLDEFSTVLLKPFRAVCFAHCIRKDFELSEPYIDLAIEHGHHVLLGGTFHRRNNPNKYDGKVPICRGDGERIADYFTDGDTSIFDEQLVCDDLDALPMADYEIFERIPYNGHIKNFADCYKLPYTISRGCIGSCKFCEVRHQPQKLRIRYSSVDDLNYLKNKYSPDLFFFTDELFPYYNTKYLDSFLPSISTPFFSFIRADIEPQKLRAMIDAGMVGCAFGVESGDEKFRNDVLGKNLTDDQIYTTADILRSTGTYFAHFYMTGYDGETFREQLKTDEMVFKLGGEPMIFDYTRVAYGTRRC